MIYETDHQSCRQVARDFLSFSDAADLIVIDNSRDASRAECFKEMRAHYIWAGHNLGFGSGHNLALKSLSGRPDVHVFLNPDVSFDGDVLRHIGERFEEEGDIAVLMPQVRYPDGRLQPLCKLLPTPAGLFVRRFLGRTAWAERLRAEYELDGLPQDRCSDVPLVSGCFLCVRFDALQAIAGFDERFFLYMEDFDLIRRASVHGRVVYDPSIFVCHGYAKGSYRNWRLLRYHMVSAVKYFNKWGWFFDPHRKKVNERALAALSSTSQV